VSTAAEGQGRSPRRRAIEAVDGALAGFLVKRRGDRE
jgi:hypothetical protein